MSTYSDASLIFYPSGYKAGTAYSLKPTDGSGDLTFTRASTATRVNSSGLIESVATGVPRIDYTGGGCGKLLLEPQRTNSFTFSENITNFSTLGRLNCGYTLGSSFGGFTTSCLITSTSFTGSLIRGVLGFNSVNTENNYFTIRFQKKSGWYLNVISGNGCASGDLRINLASGGGYISSSGTMLTDYKIVEFSDYFQIGFKTTQISTTGAGLVNLRLYDNPSFANYNDAGGTTFNVSGLQWENQQTYGTSYIPTSGTAVTRVADNASKSGISSLIGQTEGTLFVEFTPTSDINTDVISLVATSPMDNVVAIGCGSGYIYAAVYTNPNYRFGPAIAQTIPNNTFKVALCYKNNDFTFFINGVKVASGANSYSPSSPLTRMNFNQAFFFGNQVINYKSVLVFPAKLSDADAIALTA